MSTHISESWTKKRSRLANTLRQNPSADVTELRRDLKAARLEDYIKRTVDAAPPLTVEQRERLAHLLTPALAAGGGAHGDAA